MTKILLLAANPKDTSLLQLNQEIHEIDKELSHAPFGDQFKFAPKVAVRLEELSELIQKFQPDIVHFCGHGSKASEIFFEDNFGHSQPVPEAALKDIFHLLKGNIRCVVLNACYAESQANAIAEDIDCVVGMLDAIDDKAAIGFAREFYRQLANGKDVRTAFQLGRVQIPNGPDLARLLAFKANPSKIVFVKKHSWLKYMVFAIIAVILLTAIIMTLWPGELFKRTPVTIVPEPSTTQLFISEFPTSIILTTASLPSPTSTRATTLQSGTILTNPKDDAVYIWIPPSKFTMGSGDEDSRARDDEKPQHTVDIDGFWIMQTEVTNQQYKRCVETGTCAASTTKHWEEPAYANYPVTNVDWFQASNYTRWVGGRLPTEAEWEKACRGMDGRIYPWGNQALKDQLLQLLNYVENKKNRTMPVGSYPLDDHGLYDMAGNVWEWTADWYEAQYYTYTPASNPKGSDSGTAHTIRGGSFQSHNDDVRCAARGSPEPSYKSEYIGFRVVRGGSWDNIADGVRCASRYNLDPVSERSNFGFRVVVPGS